MDERKRPSKDDDVPIIGDYSEAANARIRAESRSAPSPPPTPAATRAPDEPTRAAARPTGEQWRLDPADVRRHAELARQRKRVGPLGRISRYAFVAVVLVAAFMVYWNFETLRGVTLDFSALTSLFADKSGADGSGAPVRSGTAKTEDIEAPRVAGVDSPTSVAVPPPAVARASPRDGDASARSAPPAAAPVPPPAAPEPPPGPESFEFGISTIRVSEADASAAVLILRNGDRRRASSVIWWTEDGTAKAGVDYANLGRVVEKFAAGEQNRTIHIPIIGDHQVEEPETFYVYVVASAGADPAAEPAQKLEVVITDAD